MDGTSMAAPIVTGTIALMKTLKKDLTTIQARNCLYNTAGDVYGWIPPYVLVDEALKGVKEGNFSTPVEREVRPIPGAEDDGSPAGGTTPVGGSTPVELTPPDQAVTDPGTSAPGEETDYEAIRRQIAEYQRKIDELKKLLPKE